jgi:hypothetical protein
MTTDPVVPGANAPSTAYKLGGAVHGCGCGMGLGFLCFFCAMGAAAVPLVGWIAAVGLVGAGLILPFLCAWAGYKARQ